ncbi:MAG TPA: DUF3108 domain-containing protein, partial [Thermodesulfovibrionales bacterium]|nr:DUF3108 domain-containing protein [Thermodesulfovibrionales bacterium]
MQDHNSKFRGLNPAFCILVLVSLMQPATAASFSIPETLRYDLTWTGVKAGEATLEIADDGTGTKIASTARSAKWLSFFYTVDDRVESRLLKNQSANVVGQPV